MAHLDGFGAKSVSNLMASLDKARNVEARQLLYALCIPLCGKDVCQRLLSAYNLKALVDIATNDGGLFGSGEQFYDSRYRSREVCFVYSVVPKCRQQA